MPTRLEIHLRPSLQLAALIAAVATAATLALMVSTIPWGLRALAIVWLLVLTINGFADAWLHKTRSVLGLRRQGDSWHLHCAGRWRRAELLGEKSTVTARVMCLSFKLTPAADRLHPHFHLLLLPDSASRDELRRLRSSLLRG